VRTRLLAVASISFLVAAGVFLYWDFGAFRGLFLTTITLAYEDGLNRPPPSWTIPILPDPSTLPNPYTSSLDDAPLLALSPLSSIATSAPAIYAAYVKDAAHTTVASADIDGDGRNDLIISDGALSAKGPEGYPLGVFLALKDGGWTQIKSAVHESGGASYADPVVSSSYPQPALRIYASPYGDRALSVDGQVYDWTGTNFDWDYESTQAQWLARKEENHTYAVSPSAFTLEPQGAIETVRSETDRISFAVAAGSTVRGRVLDTSILVVPPGDEEGVASPGLSIVATTSNPYYGYYFEATDAGFAALRAQPVGYHTDDVSADGESHYIKIANLTISGLPAVRMRWWAWRAGTDGGSDDDITWVRSGNMNWYIDGSFLNDTASHQAFLEQAISSVQILPR
jgi:hypothetical protein